MTDRPLDEATVLLQDAVTAAGYRPAGMDDEGTWDVELVLVDPEAVPAATPAP